MKTFDFKFYTNDYSNDEDDALPYPISSNLAASHEFSDGCTWDVILWQFCKFLESTGYVGVTDNIRLIDKYGFKSSNMLFECITDNADDLDWGLWNDTKEETTEKASEEEVEYKDIKKDIA